MENAISKWIFLSTLKHLFFNYALIHLFVWHWTTAMHLVTTNFAARSEWVRLVWDSIWQQPTCYTNHVHKICNNKINRCKNKRVTITMLRYRNITRHMHTTWYDLIAWKIAHLPADTVCCRQAAIEGFCCCWFCSRHKWCSKLNSPLKDDALVPSAAVAAPEPLYQHHQPSTKSTAVSHHTSIKHHTVVTQSHVMLQLFVITLLFGHSESKWVDQPLSIFKHLDGKLIRICDKWWKSHKQCYLSRQEYSNCSCAWDYLPFIA